MKKNVFITGISSPIITNLIELIDISAYNISGISRKNSLNNTKNTTIINGDLKTISNLNTILKDCDVLIHAAAVTHSFDEKEYYKTNFEVTKKLVDIANKVGVKKLVFISSNTSNKNNGAYAHSKYLAEQYIIKNCKNFTILRVSEVYGTNSKEGIEQLIQDTINKNFILCPLGMKFKFSPIYIKDCALSIYNLVFKKENSNKLITISGLEKFTYKELIKEIRSITKKRIFIIPVPKFMLFFIMYFTRLFPFNIGVLPDQIKRLYGVKSYATAFNLTTDIKDYIKFNFLAKE